ncbi:RagB/SusD family nutrient uptake outer membrane protein [Chitinophaga caseinilytica]|uniref:RagB/SusD family nutrient uptake outer membrane protein n=1 Tax=Chitinophaga caseinilytica TaxID=2267521 RepID=UPI003C2F6CE6
MKKIIFYISAGCMLAMGACRDYVDIKPKGVIIPQTVRDYRLLLNNVGTLSASYGTSDMGSDDYDFNTDPALQKSLGESTINIYTFQPDFYRQDVDDGEWNTLYKLIYTANVVIAGLPDATGGTQREKDQLMGEALVHRAFGYWSLINLYAKPWNESASSSDPGVPLLLAPDLNAKLDRATVKAVYDRILADLQAASSMVAEKPAVKLYPGKAAVYAMFSRTYLMRRDYVKAGKYADSALAIQSDVLDLNTIKSSPGTLIPRNIQNPEVILYKTAFNAYASAFYSQEFLTLLGTKDLRYQIFTGDGQTLLGIEGRIYNGEFLAFDTRDVGPRVPEMLLTQAEARAREGKTAEALTIINNLRRKRFEPADFSELTAATPAEALKIVLEERRRELFSRAMRWFDLRRLNLEPAFAKPVTHRFGDKSFTLEPNSVRYIYPIPSRIMMLSPEIKPNQR